MPLGITSKLYYNNSGVYAAPTWVEVDLIENLKITAAWNEGEASARREQVQVFEPTNMNLSLEGRIRKEITDVTYLFFRLMHNTRSLIDILVLDGPRTVNGSDGFRFNAKIHGWDEDQALQNVLFKEFALKPCMTVITQPPCIVIVNGGVLSFTTIGG